ncbi:MAG TPA: cation transporter [Acidimicrobiia bacterium]|nr:cation transporter [Acidimicrobiia bacterium]
MTATPATARTTPAVRHAVRLEYATVAWNVVEVVVTVGLGVAAGSLALIAFGLDSLVEIFASGVVLWHLRGNPGRERTQRALRLVALAFFVLAAVLLAGAVRDLVTEHRADESPLGIAYLGIAATAMFWLAIAKRRVSADIGNHPLSHEARVTFLDGTLAIAILLALAANVAFGWWWADTLAAAVVGVVAIFEGIAAPREHDEAGV